MKKLQLEKYLKGKSVIIGIGDRLRGDDGIGCIIVEKLKEKIKNKNLLIIEAGTTPENYLEKIVNFNPDTILFIDTLDFNSFPGDIKIIEPENLLNTGTSTHNFSLKLIFQYLKARIKSRILLIGIQPKNLNFNEELSEEVKKVLEDII